MGLGLGKDAIAKHNGLVYEAHLKAAEAKIELAIRLKDHDYIRYRLGHIRSWCQDPMLPKRLRRRCLNQYEKARSAIGDCQGDRNGFSR